MTPTKATYTKDLTSSLNRLRPGSPASDRGLRRGCRHQAGGSRTQGGVLNAVELRPIGWVESPLVDRDLAPKQGDEGAPDAWLVFDCNNSEGVRDLEVGSQIIVLTWLDRARRDVLVVHPRDDPANPLRGVFNTRSADRPNPIGLHDVQIVAIDDTRILVRNLEALDKTPIVDVKPVLEPQGER